MNIEEFLNHYSLNAPQLMWFLGAGASRSAGMPSATDIIWDLKRRYYCVKENQDITYNELSNEAVKNKIQSYLEAIGCPSPGLDDEYAYYFKLVFGDNPQLHQKYLEEQLNSSKISINSGHRVLAALMAINLARVVFTTNFDTVLETAHSFMTGRDLRAFDLNGSYAALNALNNENFPLYAKMHGDFRYYEMKNLPEQLANNDAEIERCFVNACSRYGLIVVGYSGRDKNMMAAFNKALENENAFPKGLFWITSVQGHVFESVQALIEKAKGKGIKAEIIQADTFDSLLASIWKLTNSKPIELDKKIRRSIFELPNINRYSGLSGYPLIRTNAFPVVKMPESCLSIETKIPLSGTELIERMKQAPTSAIFLRDRTILAWGSMQEVEKVLSKDQIKKTELLDTTEYLKNFRESTSFHSFCSRAIARALVRSKPLILRKRHDKYFAVISSKHSDFGVIEPILKNGLKSYDFRSKGLAPPSSLAGKVLGIENTFWMECVEISIEYYDGKFWLALVPDIWIEPEQNRREARDFLTTKKKSRFNATQNTLIDAWKQILLGNDKHAVLTAFDNAEYNASFTISTLTAYSLKAKR